ncbi:MAG: hypothetical protein ABJA67_03635, partial [Chthonomonadales bacterium]
RDMGTGLRGFTSIEDVTAERFSSVMFHGSAAGGGWAASLLAAKIINTFRELPLIVVPADSRPHHMLASVAADRATVVHFN